MTSTSDAAFQSITGALESAEPAASHPHPHPETNPNPNLNHHDMPPSAAAVAAAAPTPAARPHKRAVVAAGTHAPRAANVSASPSPNSPLSSRDASPARPPQLHQQQQRPAAKANPRPALGSRKSSTDVSPSRASTLAGSTNTTPSAAALQRALSTASIPQPSAPSAPADPIKAPRPIKPSSGPNSGDSTPHWPISPRLRSPPPPGADGGRSGSRSRASSIRNQVKKQSDPQSTPAIVVQSSSPASVSRIPIRDEPSSDPEEPVLSMKAPSRGASGAAPKLETVQESSLPATPGFDGLEAESFVSTTSTYKTSDEERNDVSSNKVTEDLSARNSSTKHSGSGSDTGAKPPAQKSKMPEQQRSASTTRQNHVTSKPSLSSLSTRSATQPSRNMTVETETVPSVAQSTIGNQDRSASGRTDGSLRLKPSNETIRPKKERKAPKRKAPSINSGTASTKADVFEQKVASAVDEANSSDSEATFIYDSNQPEQQPLRSRQHHHSRTPSMTSITSLADPRLAIRDAHKNPGKKSSMKFANPYNNPNADTDALERGDGTVRGGSSRVGGGSHHHHIGRHGQGRGTLNHIVLDNDSPMVQSSRVRGPSSRQASQPNSPRYHTFGVSNGHSNGSNLSNGSKTYGDYSTYDMDIENVADDERTPLIPTRSPRIRTPRRRNSLTLRLDRRHRHRGGMCRRFAGCLVLSILLLVVIFSAIGLIFATTKPLQHVKVQSIQNVVASQEELMMDLVVDAVNPNIIGVTVSDMDISIFAKSKHVGSDRWWRHHGSGSHDNQEKWQPVEDPSLDLEKDIAVKGVDEGNDPIEAEPRTMSLGRLFRFDSPLIFEGSFFARRNASSIGEIRLSNPGNKTETGGPDRWEEVLQHPFEIIVRGTIKYQLPLSTQQQSNPITANYTYDPDAERKRLPKSETTISKRKDEDPAFIASAQALGRLARRALPVLKHA